MTNEQIAEKAALELSDWVSHNGVDFGWFKRCFLAAIIEATNKDAEILRLTELLSKADSRNIALSKLLKVAECPECGGRGWNVGIKQISDTEAEEEQVRCRWCDERDQLLSESNEKEGGV